MDYLTEKFRKLGIDHAPGQEGLQKKKELENRIAFALQAGKYEDAKKLCDNLEQLLLDNGGKNK